MEHNHSDIIRWFVEVRSEPVRRKSFLKGVLERLMAHSYLNINHLSYNSFKMLQSATIDPPPIKQKNIYIYILEEHQFLPLNKVTGSRFSPQPTYSSNMLAGARGKHILCQDKVPSIHSFYSALVKSLFKK